MGRSCARSSKIYFCSESAVVHVQISCGLLTPQFWPKIRKAYNSITYCFYAPKIGLKIIKKSTNKPTKPHLKKTQKTQLLAIFMKIVKNRPIFRFFQISTWQSKDRTKMQLLSNFEPPRWNTGRMVTFYIFIFNAIFLKNFSKEFWKINSSYRTHLGLSICKI